MPGRVARYPEHVPQFILGRQRHVLRVRASRNLRPEPSRNLAVWRVRRAPVDLWHVHAAECTQASLTWCCLACTALHFTCKGL